MSSQKDNELPEPMKTASELIPEYDQLMEDIDQLLAESERLGKEIRMERISMAYNDFLNIQSKE